MNRPKRAKNQRRGSEVKQPEPLRCPVARAYFLWLVDFKGEPIPPKKGKKGRNPVGNKDPQKGLRVHCSSHALETSAGDPEAANAYGSKLNHQGTRF